MSTQPNFLVSLVLAVAIIAAAVIIQLTSANVPDFLLILAAAATTWLVGLFTPKPNSS